MCIRDSGKAGEVKAAIAKGVESAKKNLVKVPVLKGTVPHEQSARFGGAEVFIKPASHGTGVVAGGAMRAVLESVGTVSYTHLLNAGVVVLTENSLKAIDNILI